MVVYKFDNCFGYTIDLILNESFFFLGKEIMCIIYQIVFMTWHQVLTLPPPLYHPLEFLFKTLSNTSTKIFAGPPFHTQTHTRALRVIDARQNIREPLCGHVIRISNGQSDFWGPTKVERSYPSAIMSRLSPTESDVTKWP